MKITQTSYFKEDAEHYTNIAKAWMYTGKREEVKESIKRLERLRGIEYVKALAAKCNQKLKLKFYTV